MTQRTQRSRGLATGLLVAVAVLALTTGSIPATSSQAVPIAAAAAASANSAGPVAGATRPLAATARPTALATASERPSPTGGPSHTATPQVSASATPSPTSAPPSTAAVQSTPAPTTVVAADGLVIGYSVEGRPIVAHRFGAGPIKVALIGDIHGAFEANTHELAQLLLSHFQAYPDEVPADVSLWIVPSMNPDGLATGHRWNANDVDLNRNADTDLDGCAGNDWSPDTVGHEGPHPGAGGKHPFSEPEAVAVRDFLDDAWIAIFYHSAAEAIYRDSCQRHAPTARLAAVLSEASGYPVPQEGWVGYPITGDFGDYLAGEGVASVTVELTDHDDPEFERNLAGVRAVLAAAEEIVAAEADAAEAEYVWLDEEHTGARHYPDGTFLHPIALEVVGDTAYLLDGGRVLALDLDGAAMPRVLLAPGDSVGDVRVLEPLDLAAAGPSLLVLDRAGDVYRHDPPDAWRVERYDRPAGDTYDHYYVALAAGPEAHYLLETTHEEVWRYTAGSRGSAWTALPKGRDVDLSAGAGAIYVLTRALSGPAASLLRFPAGTFRPGFDAMHPRQLATTPDALYVLDRAGRRLLALDPASGALESIAQFPDRRAVSTVWAGPSGNGLVLAGRDTLYFPGRPDRTATVGMAGSAQSELGAEGPQPHDLVVLEGLSSLQMPIAGASVTSRDFQMPGAPRHYRLGVHEGTDFYGHTVGVSVERGTPVRAVAGGVVIRALVDYQPLTAARADAWYDECHTLGYTPPDVLDGYRGRQVWIDHGNGLVSRYAHLDSIEPGIVEGAVVEAGQVIARVGNSGTPASVDSATYDAHLHLELWIGDHYVGQFLRPIEARTWLERILQ